MVKTVKYPSIILCALALLTGCQDSSTERTEVATDGTATATEVALQCDTAGTILDAMKSDPLFQRGYVDVDEWRDQPVRHRYVHGGFEGSETRFSLYLPPKEQYDGRFFQYITPVPMNENLSLGAKGEEDKIGFAIASGAYFIETNGGGMKAMMEDTSIGAYRANAAVAQYSRVVAMEMYGCERPYGYAFGGSGGGFRTIGGMENTEGVWDGAVPFVIGSPMAMPNVFTVRMYALRVLKDKLPAIADAVDVGSDIEVADLLTKEEYKVFEEVTRMGFPRSAWYIHDKLDMHGYASLFPGVVAADPSYFSEDFWHKPGYEGYKPPQSLLDAIVEQPTKIKKLIFPGDAEQAGLKAALLGDESRGLADDAWKSVLKNNAPGVPLAIQLETAPDQNLLGANLYIKSGEAINNKFLITRAAGEFVLVGSQNGAALTQLKSGDAVEINNRDFLASQTYHRHQVPAEGYPVYDYLRDTDGNPIYPQRPMLLGPNIVKGAAGSVPSGNFKGKMIVLSNLHDTEAYPWQGDWYLQAAKGHLGEDYNNHIRLWYTDRAPHGDVAELAMPNHMVSYLGVLQQALRDVSSWVEKGIEPPTTTHYSIMDGQVRLAVDTEERGGIQPSVSVLANGGERAEVKVGESVELTANIQVPKGAGAVVQAEWNFGNDQAAVEIVDFEGNPPKSVIVKTSRSYDVPGTYFVTLNTVAQRDGNAETPYAQIRNLGRARIIVK